MMQSVQAPQVFVPDKDNTRLLRDAFGRFATGVTVITCQTEKGPVGITANSFSSVSLDPPMVLWSPDRNSNRFTFFTEAKHYAIHILSADQADVCWSVAKDGFSLQNLELHENEDGVPVLEGCLARFDCTQETLYDGGDHVIVLGRVSRAVMREDGDALAFFRGKLGTFEAK